MLLIPISGRLRKEDCCLYEASLGYTVRICFENKQTNK